MTRVGLISDTHGLLRPQAVAALQGGDFIVHGGDIGSPAILEALRAIAPLTVVRGNNDREGLGRGHCRDRARGLRWRASLCHSRSRATRHRPGRGRRARGGLGPFAQTEDRGRGGVLYVNPGSAGPRRFSLPIAVAELRIEGGAVDARIVELTV